MSSGDSNGRASTDVLFSALALKRRCAAVFSAQAQEPAIHLLGFILDYLPSRSTSGSPVARRSFHKNNTSYDELRG